MNSTDLLDRAFSVWTSALAAYRNRCLDVGRTLHEFVRAHLAEGDGKSEEVRLRRGLSRQHAVAVAATKLKVTRDKVNQLIQVSQAVDLLSDGGSVGNLSYDALRWFRLGVRRRITCSAAGRNERRASGAPAGTVVEPSETESWEVRDQRYVVLFRRAATEGWPADEVRSAVSTPRRERADVGTPEKERRRAEQGSGDAAPINLLSAVRAGTPRDVADMILRLVAASEDPQLVSRLVADSLLNSVGTRR